MKQEQKQYSEYYEKYGKYMVKAFVDAEVFREIKYKSINEERPMRGILREIVESFLKSNVEVPDDWEPPKVKEVGFTLTKEGHKRIKMKSIDEDVPIFKITSYAISLYFTPKNKIKIKRRKRNGRNNSSGRTRNSTPAKRA